MSKKVAIVTDTNSGIQADKAEKLGVFVVPMPFTIDGESYFEGVNLTADTFFTKQKGGSEIFSSQPAPASLMDTWDKVLEEYDSLVYIPMSSALSSTYATSLMLSDEYDGRVEVVNNLRISVTQRQSVLDALDMAAEGMSAAEIKQALEDSAMDASIYIMVDTLKYLQKGGRVTPAVAAVGTLLRLKPVLQIQGEKLDSFSKARSLDNAMNIMCKQAEKDIDERFGGAKNVHIYIAHTQNENNAKVFKQMLSEKFPFNRIQIEPLALSVSCHIGAGALAVALVQKRK